MLLLTAGVAQGTARVSKSSRFSDKSQVIIEAQDMVIAEQGGQISNMAKEMAEMKIIMFEAGLRPVSDVEAKKNKSSERRLPSGSPDGKMWLSTSGSDSGGEAMEEGEAPKNDDWRKTQDKKGRLDIKKCLKKKLKGQGDLQEPKKIS